MGSEPETLTLDFDRKCLECGKPGVGSGGLCLRCVTKKIPHMAWKAPRTKGHGLDANTAQGIVKDAKAIEAELQKHDARIASLKEQLKEAKEDHDEAVSSLRALVRSDMPLLDGDGDE